MDITIRPIQNDDLPAVREITWGAWMQAYSRFIPEADLLVYFNQQYSLEALAQLFSSPDVTGFMGLVSGKPAGYIKTSFESSENRFYITSVYVLPDYQGRGLGKMLFAEALWCARHYAVREVWIGVMVANTEALAWYEKLGFQFIREEPFTMGATTVAHRIGYKPLMPEDV